MYTYMSKSRNMFSGYKRCVILINQTQVLHVPSLYPVAYFDPGRCLLMAKIMMLETSSPPKPPLYKFNISHILIRIRRPAVKMHTEMSYPPVP